MTFEDAMRLVHAGREQAPPMSLWQHVKTGDIYVVCMHVIIEATLEPAVVYYPHASSHDESWCRPTAEFLDGRFVQFRSDHA